MYVGAHKYTGEHVSDCETFEFTLGIHLYHYLLRQSLWLNMELWFQLIELARLLKGAPDSTVQVLRSLVTTVIAWGLGLVLRLVEKYSIRWANYLSSPCKEGKGD